MPARSPSRRHALALLAALVLAGCGHGGKPAADTGLLAVGATPPDLQAVDQDGKLHRLADQRGRYVLVFFYPKDATPGCTREACAFRDVWDRYQAAGVQVFGVSGDDQASKAAFAQEHKLTFPLLADPERQWIAAFHVPTRLGFAKRVSFLLGPDGKVIKVYPDVDPGVHAQQVLDDVAALPR